MSVLLIQSKAMKFRLLTYLTVPGLRLEASEGAGLFRLYFDIKTEL